MTQGVGVRATAAELRSRGIRVHTINPGFVETELMRSLPAYDAQAAGLEGKDYAVKALKDGSLKMSCTDPDHPANWPRNMFVWRSNIIGSSGKGHEYFLRHLLGTAEPAVRADEAPEDRELLVARALGAQPLCPASRQPVAVQSGVATPPDLRERSGARPRPAH